MSLIYLSSPFSVLSVQHWKPLPNLRSHRFSPAFSSGDAFYFSHLGLDLFAVFFFVWGELGLMFSPLNVVIHDLLVRNSASPEGGFTQSVASPVKECTCGSVLSHRLPSVLASWALGWESVSDVSHFCSHDRFSSFLGTLLVCIFQVNFRMPSIPEKNPPG